MNFKRLIRIFCQKLSKPVRGGYLHYKLHLRQRRPLFGGVPNYALPVPGLTLRQHNRQRSHLRQPIYLKLSYLVGN